VGSRAAPWALPPVPHVPLVLELLCGGVAVGSPVGGAGAGAPALRPEDGDQVAAAERGEDLIGINGWSRGGGDGTQTNYQSFQIEAIGGPLGRQGH